MPQKFDDDIILPKRNNFPANPQEGQTFYHKGEKMSFEYDGEKWNPRSGDANSIKKIFVNESTIIGDGLTPETALTVIGGGNEIESIEQLIEVTTKEHDDSIFYDSTTDTWKNKQIDYGGVDIYIDTATIGGDGLTPQTALTVVGGTSTGGSGVTDEEKAFWNAKQPSGDYVTTASLTSGLNTKQPVGDYATNSALTAGLNTKQPTGDYATNSALSSGLAGKQAAGDYVISSTLSNYATITALSNGLASKQAVGDYATNTSLTSGLASKQSTLVSGTSIKTINGNNLLGSGNITISGEGGGGGAVDAAVVEDSPNAVSGGGVFIALQDKADLDVNDKVPLIQLPDFALNADHFDGDGLIVPITVSASNPLIDGIEAIVTVLEQTKVDINATTGKAELDQLPTFSLSQLHFAGDGINSAITIKADGPVVAPLAAGVTNLTSGKANRKMTIKSITDTNYVPVLGDEEETLLRVTANGTTTTVIPNDATTNFGIGSILLVVKTGTGAHSWAAQAGASIVSPNNALTFSTQYSTSSIIKIAANLWLTIGDVSI